MKLLLTALVLSFAVTASAQTKRVEWKQEAANLSQATSYRYVLEIDGSQQATPLISICVGTTSPFTCSATLPPLVPGLRKLKLRTYDLTTVFMPLASEPSDELEYTKPAPATPTAVVVK